MNIHLFMDPFGYYSTQFAERADRIDRGNNIIVNINKSKFTRPDIVYFNGYGPELRKWLDSQVSMTRIYYHYYNPIFQKINLRLKKKNPSLISVWSFWGGDFYSLPEFVSAKYLGFSKKATARSGIPRSNIFRRFGVEVYYRMRGNVPYNHKRFIASFKKIDVLATYFEEDYKRIADYSKTKMRFLKFPYLSLDLILGEIQSNTEFKHGTKIMIGHSADPGLNHYEIIDLLNRFRCEKTLFLPMAYGDKSYKAKLLDAMKSMNLKIEVLDEQVSPKEYNEKLGDVGFAIFNVNHQQAFGNIITLIWLGVKVFLHRESAIYKDFKKNGFHIYSVDDIHSMADFEHLSEAQKMHNRKLLEGILSPEVANEMNLKLLTI